MDCFKNQTPNKIKNLNSRQRGNDGETQGDAAIKYLTSARYLNCQALNKTPSTPSKPTIQAPPVAPSRFTPRVAR
jgi:hypothetical protein